jgi:hypothetical protein
MESWFKGYYSFLGMILHCYFPLGGFGFPLLGDLDVGGCPLVLGFYSSPFTSYNWVDEG